MTYTNSSVSKSKRESVCVRERELQNEKGAIEKDERHRKAIIRNRQRERKGEKHKSAQKLHPIQ
jgi:hypothetical protein